MPESPRGQTRRAPLSCEACESCDQSAQARVHGDAALAQLLAGQGQACRSDKSANSRTRDRAAQFELRRVDFAPDTRPVPDLVSDGGGLTLLLANAWFCDGWVWVHSGQRINESVDERPVCRGVSAPRHASAALCAPGSHGSPCGLPMRHAGTAIDRVGRRLS